MAATHSEFFSIFIFLNFFGLINYFIVNFFLFSIFSPFSNYRNLKTLIFFPFQFFSLLQTLLIQTFLKKFTILTISTCITTISFYFTGQSKLKSHRARKSRRTLQNKVRIKVFPEQLTLFINTFVALKQCIIQ